MKEQLIYFWKLNNLLTRSSFQNRINITGLVFSVKSRKKKREIFVALHKETYSRENLKEIPRNMASAKTTATYSTDDLELIFEEMLTVSNVDALHKLCVKFGVEERHWKGKNKIYATKALRRETEKDEEEEKRSILLRLCQH